MGQSKDKEERCNYLNVRFFRFDCSSIEFFPTVCIVGYTQKPTSSLRSSRGIGFSPGCVRTNPPSKSSDLKCAEHITECFDGCQFALFCFTKSTHFFLRFFDSCRSSPKKRYYMQWYTFSFVFMIAATNRNTNCRHFLPSKVTKNNCGYVKDVDFALSAGKEVFELTSLVSFSPVVASLGLKQKWRLFRQDFLEL